MGGRLPNVRAEEQSARIPALDGVRGIAILTVLLGHLTDYGGMHPVAAIDRLYHHIALLGGLGVDLFFVLSGFLITGILLDAKDAPHYVRNFYVRRILRIFPLYYAFLFIVFVIAPWAGWTTPALAATLPDQGWYWGYLANYRIAFAGWPAFGGVGHFWSLAVEEQFYVVWPLVVAMTSRRVFTAVCGALVVAGPVVRWLLHLEGLPAIANVVTPARVDALALGALVAVVVRSRGGIARLTRWTGPIASGAGVLLAILVVWAHGWNTSLPVIPIGGRVLTILASTGLIALAIGTRPGSRAQRLLAHPVLVFYGVISYGLYVFHPPILIVLARFGLTVNLVPTVGGSQLPGQILVNVVGTAVATAAAYVSFRWFESPILRLKSRFGPAASPVLPRGAEIVPMRSVPKPQVAAAPRLGEADGRREAPREVVHR